MDTAYLKKSLGDSLTRCLDEVAAKRPRDPIEYMAQWLYKYVDNQNHIAEKKKEAELLEQQRKDFEKDCVLKEKRKAEAKRIAEKEAERLKVEEERAKKENVSPTKLPVVMEAQEPSEEAKSEQNTEASQDKQAEEEKPAEETPPAEKEESTPEEPKQEEEPQPQPPADEEAS